MKNLFKLCGLAGLIGLAGCGGNGGSASNPSPFQGTWSGTVTESSGGSFQVNWTIAATGYINGNDNLGGAQGADSGFVDLSGALKVTSKVGGTPNILFKANVSLSQQTGDLLGTGTETSNGVTQTINFDLVLQ